MGNNCSSKICKTQRKNIIVEFIFSKVVNQKSEAVTNMEPFLNVFWGILQNLQGAASGVNIWIRTITFTVKIVQTTTGISVIFIILSTVNILLDNFFTLLFTTSVIMFDKSNLIIILKYLMMLVKTILVLKHQKNN